MPTPEEGKQEPKATEKVSVGFSDLDISEDTKKVLTSAEDVSDAALKAAKLKDKAAEESTEKVSEAAEEKTDSVDSSSEKVVDSESDLDAVFKEILAEKESDKKKSLVEKDDRPEINKIRELERKVEKLSELNRNREEQLPTAPRYSEDVYKMLAERADADVEDVKRVTSILDMAFATQLKPQLDAVMSELNALKEKATSTEVKSQIVKDKLFEIVKDDYEEILKTDETVRSLPEAHRHKVALAMAKERNMDKILLAVRKKATSTRRVIPSDDTFGSVVASPTRKASILNELSREDIEIAKRLGLSAADLKNAATKQTYIEG